MTKVTFGINNYNRLYYLMSCAESLMESVKDYPNTEFICVDGGSKEYGTEDYLSHLESIGWKIFRQEQTNYKTDNVSHISPFSDALNTIYYSSSGEIVIPLQGDSQFIRHNWIREYIELVKSREDVGCILLDAQRRQRLSGSKFETIRLDNGTFAIDISRTNINGAGDCAYQRSLIDSVGGWHTSSPVNAEDTFTRMVSAHFESSKKVYVPWMPVSVVICTDERGTNARVRGDKRYGKYWKAENNLYYEWIDDKKIETSFFHPVPIESVVFVTNKDFTVPIDDEGNWIKNPLSITEHEEYETIS
jgi:glycosyltransferase involved in cell wall biosynthesis